MTDTDLLEDEDADILDGERPYETLGVTEEDTLNTIKNEKQRLLNKCKEKRSEGRRKDDNELFINATEGMQNVNSTWDWIDENHEPPAADQSVSIDILTDDPEVGSPVSVRVTGDSGPVEDTLVNPDHDSYEVSSDTTDSDGKVKFTFKKYGHAKFTVPTTDAYEDATEKTKINRKQVDLSFDSPPEEVEVNQNVTFTVTGDGSPEEDVTVKKGKKKLGKTGSSGSVTHAFSNVGSHTIEANKPEDSVAEYSECNTEVKVSEETVELEVYVDYVEGSDHEIGDRVIAHVNEKSGSAVKDAEVTIGSNTGTTKKNGEAELKLKDGGKVTVKAEKSAPDEDRNYSTAKTQIDVSKRDGSLRIDSVEGKKMEKSTLTAHIVDGSDQELEDATVETDWGHKKSTDKDGKVEIDLNDSGRLKIKASKETDEVDYGSTRQWLEIKEYSREIHIADVTPKVPDPGGSIKIKVVDGADSPVSDAKITSSKQTGKEWRTDDDGEKEIPISDQVGNRIIKVRKDGGGDEITIRVLG